MQTTNLDANTLLFETRWTWYAHFPSASTNYGISYVALGTFSTVAEFWRMYNHLPCIENVHRGRLRVSGTFVIAYSLFRENVRPEWEDPVNLRGSEWGCRENLDVHRFRELWKMCVLGAIGENIPHCVGIRAINKSNRTRNLHKIEVWMNCADNRRTQACRKSLSEIVPSSPRFLFMLHTQKQTQAIEYQKKCQKHGHGAAPSSADAHEESG